MDKDRERDESKRVTPGMDGEMRNIAAGILGERLRNLGPDEAEGRAFLTGLRAKLVSEVERPFDDAELSMLEWILLDHFDARVLRWVAAKRDARPDLERAWAIARRFADETERRRQEGR